MRNLLPDETDISLMMTGKLSRCPFCAGLASTINKVNDGTGIHRAIVNCGQCHGQASYNARSRVDALRGAIERWERRTPALVPHERPTPVVKESLTTPDTNLEKT